MTSPDVVTVRHIEAERVRLSGILERATKQLAEAARQHAVAEHAYRQAHATAMLAATGTGPDKKAKADQAAGQPMAERNKWRAEETIAIEACRNLRQQLSTLAAAAYAVNSDMRMAGAAG